jgi:iron complex transport system ATP-binding protein
MICPFFRGAAGTDRTDVFRLTSQSISVETDPAGGQAPVALRCTGVRVWRWHQASGSRKPLLDDVAWTVRRGERWALLGPNGAGKTTLLTLAAAADFPSSGSVEILGETMGRTDTPRLREQIGFVDARDGDRFAPMLSVREVVRTGATGTIGYFEQRLGMLDIDRADTLIGTFGLGQLAERRFGDCSQGERKRVLIARALVGKPRLLLLDEPGAGLDLPGREILLGSLARLTDVDPELTMIVTTHHLEELHGSTTHALLLRDGHVLAAGPVEHTLTDELLTVCFGIPIVAQRRGDRWTATAG